MTAATAPAGELADLVRSRVRDVPDYPEPGVMFRDITPLLADPVAFGRTIEALADGLGPVDIVAGIEARGFIVAAPLALRLGAGFLPVRKAGKLPGETVGVDYGLEYGEARIEILADAVSPGDRVLVVDDVLATGGTAAAAVELVENRGGHVVGLRFLIELAALGGRAKLPSSIPAEALATL